MQVFSLKKIIFFSFCFLLSVQVSNSQGISKQLQKADFLFREHKLSEAGQIYQQLIDEQQNVSVNGRIKYAYILEKQGNWVNALWLLSGVYEKTPTPLLLEHIKEIVSDKQLKGYDYDDLNYFYLLYKRYSFYVTILLVLFGTYIFGVLVIKKQKREFTPIRHFSFLVIYLIGIIILINVPNTYRKAIVKANNTYLRNAPSAGADLIGNVDMGNQLNIIGKEDIWLAIKWQDQTLYVREDLVLPIE
jgi:hypothetical protein